VTDIPNHQPTISEQVETLAQHARDTLGPFCMTTCGALCCKRGAIYLQSKKEETLFPQPLQQLTSSHSLKVNLEPKCIHLSEQHMCSIYTQRPKSCNEFPVYVRGKTIIIASWCTGYQHNKLDSFIEQFTLLGCSVFIQ